MLRARRASREQSVGSWLPEPIVQDDGPEQQAELADSVGMALLVVLDALAPAERLAFVLHDVFAMPFDEIAPIVDRTPTRPGSWPVGPGAACSSRHNLIATSPSSGESSARFSPRRETGTSRRC